MSIDTLTKNRYNSIRGTFGFCLTSRAAVCIHCSDMINF